MNVGPSFFEIVGEFPTRRHRRQANSRRVSISGLFLRSPRPYVGQQKEDVCRA